MSRIFFYVSKKIILLRINSTFSRTKNKRNAHTRVWITFALKITEKIYFEVCVVYFPTCLLVDGLSREESV